MINEFMPDIESIYIQDNTDTFIAFAITMPDPDRPFRYEISASWDTERNKAYWIVFKHNLYTVPTMRYPRYRISLYNYPTDSLDHALELACNNAENHFILNHHT